jgi:hypothetical protein
LKDSESSERFANALQAGDERSRLYFLSKTDVIYVNLFSAVWQKMIKNWKKGRIMSFLDL